MNCTASSYFIPLSMRAKATKTGALRGKRKSSGPVQGDGERMKGGEKENRRLNAMVHMVP